HRRRRSEQPPHPLHGHRAPRDPHSLPPRRSSDLRGHGRGAHRRHLHRRQPGRPFRRLQRHHPLGRRQQLGRHGQLQQHHAQLHGRRQPNLHQSSHWQLSDPGLRLRRQRQHHHHHP